VQSVQHQNFRLGFVRVGVRYGLDHGGSVAIWLKLPTFAGGLLEEIAEEWSSK
jgi:hypothetical protein